MLYNYTVTLQSKQRNRPQRWTIKAHNLSEIIKRLKNLKENYSIKSIVRTL